MKTIQSSQKNNRYLPFGKISFRVIAWAILTGMAIVMPVNYLVGLLPFSQFPIHDLPHVQTRTLALQALFIYPLVEECFYRGLILQSLRRYVPLWLAIVVPTFIFGLSHLGFSPQNAVFAFVLGLYFSWVAIQSRSLFPAILCHASVNLFVVFILGFVLAKTGNMAPTTLSQPLPMLLLGISVVVLTLGVKILRKEFQRNASVAAI